MSNFIPTNFDSFASEYRSVHSQNLHFTGAESEFYSEYKILEVLKRTKNDAPALILDFGCGDGTTSYFFSKHFPDQFIHGIDISAASIKIANEKNIANSEFKIFDGEIIPFDSETFDVVFIANVLHHIDFELHQQVLCECRRVLKHNSSVFVFEHNPLNPVTRKLFNDCIFDRDAKLLRQKYLHKQMLLSGFEQINTSYHLFFPRQKIFKAFHYLERYLTAVPVGGQYCIQGIKP
jgi:ubiquinone/menaquinone biosynthesis C-methylase UbiE